jgi:hypothetical protein
MLLGDYILRSNTIWDHQCEREGALHSIHKFPDQSLLVSQVEPVIFGDTENHIWFCTSEVFCWQTRISFPTVHKVAKQQVPTGIMNNVATVLTLVFRCSTSDVKFTTASPAMLSLGVEELVPARKTKTKSKIKSKSKQNKYHAIC